MENRLISVTDLSAYKWCPRALYLKLVLGLREPAKPVMVLGSIRHNVYDEANKKEEELVKQIGSSLQRQEILQIFAREYEKALNYSVYRNGAQLQQLGMDKETVTEGLKPAVAAQAEKRADEILGFATANNVFGEALWESLKPKVITEMSVRSSRLRLKGKVDRIEVYGSEYVPVEIKTGRAPSEGVWPDHRIQVSAYMLLLKDNGIKVREGLVKYVAANQTRQIVMNPFMEYEVTGLVNEVFGLIESKNVPEYCGSEKCGVCSLGEDYERNLVKKAAYY